MRLRAFIFDDNDAIRHILWTLCNDRGYEVFTYPDPGFCPLHVSPDCQCPQELACTDVIISDLNMQEVNGLDFVEGQIRKGCRCKHIALISGAWLEPDLSRARELGCKVLEKPFSPSEITEWLEEVEKQVDPERKLSTWWLSRSQSEGGR